MRINSPLQSFFAKEIALAQKPDVLLLLRVGLLDGHSHLSLADDEESLTARTLAYYVIPIVVVHLQMFMQIFIKHTIVQCQECQE